MPLDNKHKKYWPAYLWLVLFIPMTLLIASCTQETWPPEVQPRAGSAAVLSPQEALQSFHLPPGYDIELVASEPMVVDPVAMDLDADERLGIVAITSYSQDIKGRVEN